MAASFVIAFDNGNSSEFNTLLVTDWIAHTPPEVLAKNFGVPAEAFKNIPLHNKWIYQTNTPAPPLTAVADGSGCRQAAKPVCFQARRYGAESRDQEWHGTDCR